MATLQINKKQLIWTGVIILAFVSIFFAGWWMRPPKVIYQHQQIDSLRNAHREDSLRYAFELTLLMGRDSVLNNAIIQKDKQIDDLKKNLSKEIETIILLPATETVGLFSHNTGDTAKIIVIGGDTTCIVSIPSIRLCNVLFAERNACISENIILQSKVETCLDLVDEKNDQLNLTYGRIEKLTDEYYRSQSIINNQQKYMGKYAKKVRNRNIFIGIISGVAAGGIVTAMLIK